MKIFKFEYDQDHGHYIAHNSEEEAIGFFKNHVSTDNDYKIIELSEAEAERINIIDPEEPEPEHECDSDDECECYGEYEEEDYDNGYLIAGTLVSEAKSKGVPCVICHHSTDY